MASLRRQFTCALVVLAGLFAAAPVRAAEDGPRAPQVGIVHAAGDEAWIDLPASLGDTWKATLAELKQRGRVTDDNLSYVESNGQIALDTLWIAVLPGASLDTPITRVRMVVLVSADEHEQHTAALVGAGALLGAIAQRLPAAAATPAPFGALPAGPVVVDDPLVEPVRSDDGLVATYNTYNTYNTYDSDPAYEPVVTPVYVGYAPAVYVWKPWWWLGWCNSNWYFGWNSWGWNSWGWGSSCWNFGWGWNSYYQPWWGYPSSFCGPVSSCDPWWWDCDDNNSWDQPDNSSYSRDRYNYNHAPGLSFTRRTDLAGATGTGTSGRSPRITEVKGDRSSLSPSGKGSSSGRHTSGRLATVDAFPTQHAPGSERGRTSTRGSKSSGSIVLSGRSSSSSTRAKPGSVTKLKGLSLTTRLGGIHDANSLARSSASTSSGSSSSPGFSASKSSRPASPFTITNNSSKSSSSSSRSSSSQGNRGSDSGRSSAGSSSSSSNHGYPSISGGPSSSSGGSDSGSGRSSASRPSPGPSSVPSHQSRPSTPAPAPAPRPSAPAPHISGGHSSGGGSSASSGASSAGRSSGGGGGGGGGSGRSSGRGPR